MKRSVTLAGIALGAVAVASVLGHLVPSVPLWGLGLLAWGICWAAWSIVAGRVPTHFSVAAVVVIAIAWLLGRMLPGLPGWIIALLAFGLWALMIFALYKISEAESKKVQFDIEVVHARTDPPSPDGVGLESARQRAFGRLLSQVFGDRAAAERLIAFERGRDPTASEVQCIEAASRRIEDDNAGRWR